MIEDDKTELEFWLEKGTGKSETARKLLRSLEERYTRAFDSHSDSLIAIESRASHST